MKRSDHILALVSTLLTCPRDIFDSSLDLVNAIYDVNEPRKPGFVSLGFVNEDDVEFSLKHWLIEMRSKPVLSVTCFYGSDDLQDMAPHMAAAFAGSSDLLLQVDYGDERQTFKVETYHSTSYEITTQQFVSVLQAQPNQALVWTRAAELILESNRLNNRTVFEPNEVIDYLKTQEGGSVFDFLAPELIKEIQIECSIHNVSFVIPTEFQSLFVKYEPFGFETENDKEYVYLYTLRNITVEELLTLVEAQSFESEVWVELNKTLEEWKDERLSPMPVTQWKGKLMSLDQEMLMYAATPICRSICVLCEEKNLKPVIPAELADAFGPSEEDQKRAAARSKNEKDRWSLQPRQKPWEFVGFRKLEFYTPIEALKSDQVQSAFINSLKDIQEFSASIYSSYEEAFKLSLFILENVKDFAEQALEQQMKGAGFSDRAWEIMKDRLWIVDHFTKLGWSFDRIKALMAVSMADVFGGMGSWNDQYIEGDQERYQTVSANLFQSMKDYFAVIVSKY